ncbi:MAG: hypothetical protein ABIV26_07710 [Candidatus Limnocylindrales bacterium]
MAPPARPETPRQLRLMPFGKVSFRKVKDGIWEPVWAGRRALVQVLGRNVTIRDEQDAELDGYEPLRAAIVEAARAEELVIDGYLLPAPLRTSSGAEAPLGLDNVLSAGEMGRQMLLGGALGSNSRDEITAPPIARVAVPSQSPTAFVAVDLLWLDGEPLLDVPLQERKRLLDSILVDGEIVRRTVTVRPPVETWFAQ